jgi:hypothetical protein
LPATIVPSLGFFAPNSDILSFHFRQSKQFFEKTSMTVTSEARMLRRSVVALEAMPLSHDSLMKQQLLMT